MKKLMSLMVLLIIVNETSAQDKMIVDQPPCGSTHYGGFEKYLYNYSDLPSIIQLNIEGFLKKILGSMSDSTTFHRALILDLNEFFKDDSITFNREWIVPKYDLCFVLRDNSMGFKNFNIRIKLDEYGQIQYSNYPRSRHSDKSTFPQRSTIERIALKHALDYNYDISDYKVYYTLFDEKLCWGFDFPSRSDKTGTVFNTIVISWLEMEIIDEFVTHKRVLH